MSDPSTTDDTADLLKPGELLAGKYRIDRLIGQGGMGAVYVAQHEILHQSVAIKLLLPEIAKNPEAVMRFLNEARAAARIRSEHVAAVMDVGKLDNGSAYMVLEYLDGSDLGDVLATRGALPVEEAIDFTLQALEALAQAHALGIIHRDLKPANLFLSKRQDGSSIVKVLDFGISKATNPLAAAANSAVTSTKALLGSPGYMSPEQVRSSKHVDARTDIWSVGVILYRLLTNVAPFDGENLGAVFAAILEEAPKPICEIRPEVPDGLAIVVARCLEKNRDNRSANVAELAMSLSPFASAEGALSADRICRTLAVTPSKLTRTRPASSPNEAGATGLAAQAAPSSVTGAKEAPAQASTAASWSDSSSQPPAAKKPNRVPLMAAAALVVVGALAFVGVKAMSGAPAATGAAAVAPPATTPVRTAEPATATATATTTATATEPTPVASTATSASASASATVAVPPPPRPTATAKTAPPPPTKTTPAVSDDVLLQRR